MNTQQLPTQSPEDVADRDSRVHYRVEARNEYATTESARAFDFVITEPHEQTARCTPSPGLLAGYLGAAGYSHSFTLDLELDIERVLVEVEGPTARTDGSGTTDQSSSTLNGEPPYERVRALIEVTTTEPTSQIKRWRDRLVADQIPASMVPELVGIDFLVQSRAAPERAETGSGADTKFDDDRVERGTELDYDTDHQAGGSLA